MDYEAVFIGLGSNLGRRLENIIRALTLIEKLPFTEICECSSVYETAPVGNLEQGDFLNQVIRITTGITPDDFFAECLHIENRLGRQRRVKWGPRTLDIDLLFWGNLKIQSEKLVVPHPRVEGRRFVLEPLGEIAPFFVTPCNHKTVQELLQACPDRNSVTLYLPKEDFAFN